MRRRSFRFNIPSQRTNSYDSTNAPQAVSDIAGEHAEVSGIGEVAWL